MAFPRPVVLIHGYSDKGESFKNWRDALIKRGADVRDVNVCTYVSLNNEININDIAEGLDRALEYTLRWKDEEFDAVVHSTGMLVLRAWLTNYKVRKGRLKHLVGLAPATWGSPLAHKGRGLLGSIFKGRHDPLSPDFLNAGDEVLGGLELGSEFTWDLAHKDMLGEPPDYLPMYTNSDNDPFVAVFIGDTPYGGIRSVVNEPGTDGTVRWSGCGFNTRKLTVDLLRTDSPPVAFTSWTNGRLDIPIIGVPGVTHASILHNPDTEGKGGVLLADLVADFLTGVKDGASHEAWLARATKFGEDAIANMDSSGPKGTRGWQQFVVHAVDERGEGIADFSISLFRRSMAHSQDGSDAAVEEFEADVHSYKADPSYRCFHINLPETFVSDPGDGAAAPEKLFLRLNAATGTELLTYRAYSDAVSPMQTNDGEIELEIEGRLLGPGGIFARYTTTLIEIRLNRETVPLADVSKLLFFLPKNEGAEP